MLLAFQAPAGPVGFQVDLPADAEVQCHQRRNRAEALDDSDKVVKTSTPPRPQAAHAGSSKRWPVAVGGSGRQGSLIHSLGRRCHLVPMIRGFHRSPAVCPQGAAMVVVREQRADPMSKSVGGGIYQEAVDIMPDKLSGTTGGGGYDRFARRPGL